MRKDYLRIWSAFVVALNVWMAQPTAHAQVSAPGETAGVTAIDILLLPDEVMIEHAAAANARLLKNYPHGFSLDATHHPHVSCLQRYVRTADLEEVYSAVAKVLEGEK